MPVVLDFWEVLTVIIASLSFIFGAVMLFREKTPMYFQFAVCSAGCLALEELYNLLCLLCTGEYIASFSIGTLGYAGSLAFLLCANAGTFDSIFSDIGQEQKKRKRLAWIAPVILALVFVPVCVLTRRSVWGIVITVLIFASAIPCSYFNLKILLLSGKDNPFLRAVKPMNLLSLIYCTSCITMIASYALGSEAGYNISFYTMAFSTLGLVIAAVWGRKKWLTQ